MPIYEYKCNRCGRKFDKRRGMSEADAPAECPECGVADTTRQVTACAIVSKSGGLTTSIGGGSCGSCAGGNCGSCGH